MVSLSNQLSEEIPVELGNLANQSQGGMSIPKIKFSDNLTQKRANEKEESMPHRKMGNRKGPHT